MDGKRVIQFGKISALILCLGTFAQAKDVSFDEVKMASGKSKNECQSPDKMKIADDQLYSPKTIEMYFNNAEKCMAHKSWNHLQSTAERITRTIPNEAWGYYYNGIASAGLKKTDKALWLYDQALKKAEKLSEQTKAYIYYEKAKALEGSGQKSAAFEFFQKASKGGVKNSDVDVYLALEEFNKGNCDTLLKQDGAKTEEAAIGLAECLGRANKGEKALKVLASQLKVRKSVPVFLQEARVHEIFMADPSGAVKSYQNAAAMDTGGDRKAWIMKKIDHLKSQYTHLVSQNEGAR